MNEPQHRQDMLERERIANKRKHWVRAVTACNSHCIFCLDSDTPRNVFVPLTEVEAEIQRGRDELDAEKIIISGGEASLHPDFHQMIRFAKGVGYDRVQTVTNGYRFADAGYYEASVEAGLGEITFSLHGNTAALHDRLTQTQGAFKRLMRAMIRASRDPRMITNVDIVINKQNVAVIDRIVELCLSVGVREFDLLHVIPQAAAFDHRDELFYDPREHLPNLQRVFRLNRHPSVVVWTNRFPISYLEGMEELIQDPHKMLDEVNGRRWQVRRYLDAGQPLDCRQPDRCVHCFIEPFCTFMDRTVQAQIDRHWDVWWIGSSDPERYQYEGELPFGCTQFGVVVADWEELQGLNLPYDLYVSPTTVVDIQTMPSNVACLEGHRREQLSAWFRDPLPKDLEIVIGLNQETAPWMLENRDILKENLDQVRVHQVTHEHLAAASAQDIDDPTSFFEALQLRIRVSGLAPCQTPGTDLATPKRILDAGIFGEETGRIEIRRLARTYIRDGYRAHSVRCADCRVRSRCDGIHINQIRAQGLAVAKPLTDGAWAEDADRQLCERWPEPPTRLATGRPPIPVAPSLAGFPEPQSVMEDPLGALANQVVELGKKRRAEKRAVKKRHEGGVEAKEQ